MASEYVDCCENPSLEKVKVFLSTDYDIVAIRRCRSCGCYWYYWIKERTFSDADTYDRSIWYVRLNPEEANVLADASAAPELSLFKDRPGLLKDSDGMNAIRGIPRFLE